MAKKKVPKKPSKKPGKKKAGEVNPSAGCGPKKPTGKKR